jgi:hypothetical protein
VLAGIDFSFIPGAKPRFSQPICLRVFLKLSGVDDPGYNCD